MFLAPSSRDCLSVARPCFGHFGPGIVRIPSGGPLRPWNGASIVNPARSRYPGAAPNPQTSRKQHGYELYHPGFRLAATTFAIISHPDAGKTTLTEKLLLFGGAIQLAGAVKARGEQRRARSDWMKVERERGISVTASVMTFEYGGCTFNLLDTPGPRGLQRGHLPHAHRRRLGRDGASTPRKGIEDADAQALRGLPPARRADHHVHQQARPRGPRAVRPDATRSSRPRARRRRRRAGRSAWGATSSAATTSLQGSADAHRAPRSDIGAEGEACQRPRRSEARPRCSPESACKELREEVEMARGLCPRSTSRRTGEGHLTPVFFGSALNNFGVRELLDGLGELAPPPRPQRDARADGRARRGQGHRLRLQDPGEHGSEAPRPRRLRAPLLRALRSAA